MGFMDFFTSRMKFPQVSKTQQYILDDWLRGRQRGAPGSGSTMEQNALTDMFNAIKNAQTKGTPFYESLIPSAPGALSPAAAAQKSAATDALQTQLGSAGVSQLGQLNREYGGRLPASMVQSGFGNLARAGAGGATDIARQAIGQNINLGEQGVSGLAGLSGLGGEGLSAVNSLLGGSMAGGFVAPPAGKEIGQTIGALAAPIASSIAGFSGLGKGTSPGPGGPAGPSRQYLPLGMGG